MDQANGYYDYNTRIIYPTSTSTWSGLASTTWDNWKEWAYAVNDQIIWVTSPIFIGNSPEPFNLEITCESTGDVSYKVYTSNTGGFNGEETETVISHTALSVTPFRASYIQVVVYADKANGVTPTISEISITTRKPVPIEYVINDLDSSTCGGTQTARVIPLPAVIANIIDVRIMPRETASPYNLDVYVTATPTSTYLIPKVISKSATNPTFALVGVDNQPRDGIVDIVIKSLPNTRMDGNNLVTE